MKAYVESYEDGKSIIKICGEDDAVVECFQVNALILENRVPVCFRSCPDVKVTVDVNRN